MASSGSWSEQVEWVKDGGSNILKKPCVRNALMAGIATGSLMGIHKFRMKSESLLLGARLLLRSSARTPYCPVLLLRAMSLISSVVFSYSHSMRLLAEPYGRFACVCCGLLFRRDVGASMYARVVFSSSSKSSEQCSRGNMHTPGM